MGQPESGCVGITLCLPCTAFFVLLFVRLFVCLFVCCLSSLSRFFFIHMSMETSPLLLMGCRDRPILRTHDNLRGLMPDSLLRKTRLNYIIATNHSVNSLEKTPLRFA